MSNSVVSLATESKAAAKQLGASSVALTGSVVRLAELGVNEEADAILVENEAVNRLEDLLLELVKQAGSGRLMMLAEHKVAALTFQRLTRWGLTRDRPSACAHNGR